MNAIAWQEHEWIKNTELSLQSSLSIYVPSTLAADAVQPAGGRSGHAVTRGVPNRLRPIF